MMRQICRKLRSRRGFTLTEMIIATGIMLLVALVLGVGIATATRVYREVTVHSEASVLCGTLSAAMSDELRYASDPRGDGSFDSRTYGEGVSFQTDNGRIRIGGYDLLSEKAYTSGLEASAAVSYQDGAFRVRIAVTEQAHTETLAEADFTIRPLGG